MKNVVVIGGGVAGLTTALHLADGATTVPGGLQVTVLECAESPGGNIGTENDAGYVIERGPNGWLDNAPMTGELIRRLGLESRLQQADPSVARRFIFRDGRLHEVPTAPLAFLRSPLLSRRGRARVLLEPLGRRRPEGVDETVYDFAARRIGHEAASVLVSAMVSGVFAGDAGSLSLVSTFPRMAAMEAEHGCLVKAMMARQRQTRRVRREGGDGVSGGGPAGPGGTLTSLDGGLRTLVETLASRLEGSLRTSCRVNSVQRAEGRWRVSTTMGRAYEADAVILSVPAPEASRLVRNMDAHLARMLREITHAGLAVVALGYDAADLGRVPSGFGFLAPHGTGLRILGCLWDSSIFPGRAPEGKVLLRAMIGGAHDRETGTLGDEVLEEIVLADLRTAMGLESVPELVRVYRHPVGIGQYTVGHARRLAHIAARLGSLPGLWLAGASYHGVAMNACIERARADASQVLEHLGAPASAVVSVRRIPT